MADSNLFIENKSIKEVFDKAVNLFKNNIFLSYPKNKNTDKVINYSYYDVKKLVEKNIKYFKSIDIQYKDRVSVILGNTPEFFIIKLSLSYIGVSCVPLNHELNNEEISYIIKHSKSIYIISSNKFIENIKNITAKLNNNTGITIYQNNTFSNIKIRKRRKKYILNKVKANDEASLIYTSGTTGKPKGCILSNFYEINSGHSYRLKKGLISIKNGKEKIYNCLPVHHVNAGILSFYAALLTGNCQIQADRFSATYFWRQIKFSEATIFHYLGIMVPVLLKKRKSSIETSNNLKVGIGAGIEPSFHKSFEVRFNVPMVELWGMTEMVRCIFDYKKNRIIGRRCFGKPDKSLETKVVDNYGNSLINKEGELIIRHNKLKPNKGFFDGYFKDKKESNKVWKNDWFYTGDIVLKNKSGYLFFVDRKKNIIRRSGENISSAQVEASLLNIDEIKSAAVCAYPHKVYDEEVLAFLILKNKEYESKKFAKNIIYKLSKNLAYFKLPAYIQFTDNLPVTSSQKIKKGELIKRIKKQTKFKLYDFSDYKKSFRIN